MRKSTPKHPLTDDDDDDHIMASTTNILSQRRLTLERDTSRLEMATFRYPQSDLMPSTGIQRWESQLDVSAKDDVKENRPAWLYPRIDMEAEARFGHCCLKMFALMARLAVVTYWIATDLPGISNWGVLVLFYHTGPGLLGVETSAIVPYIFSPLPFRTLSWFHDIVGLILGFSTITAVYMTSTNLNVVSTLLTLTVIPLFVDLIIHIVTLPKHVAPVY